MSAWWGLIIPVSDLVAKTDDEKDMGSDFDWGRPSNEQGLSERDEVRCSVNVHTSFGSTITITYMNGCKLEYVIKMQLLCTLSDKIDRHL
ncbi:MAG: hypothetical protein WBZ36_12925 [Candidatus Nitrosopolaris sp.]